MLSTHVRAGHPEPVMLKYPRTPHLSGSHLQPGDDGSDRMTIVALKALYPDASFITEEKLDGANCGISFDSDLNLTLQSRGHVLTGGAREAQFGPLKAWASTHEADLLEIFEDRYICYGECLFARHTMFYDNLPHLFFEFDIYDKKTEVFLSTDARRDLLSGSPILSVPVLSEDWPASDKALSTLIRRPLYQTDTWRDNLALAAERAGVDPDQAIKESGECDLAEGLYIKIEQDRETIARFKLVRSGFLQTILESGTHWHDRPIIRNQMGAGIDIMSSPTRALDFTP